MESNPEEDWKTKLQPDSRERVVILIFDILRINVPITEPEIIVGLKKNAARFEEKVYSASTTQSDYVSKISVKILLLATKYGNTSLTFPMTSDSQGPVISLDMQDCQTSLFQLQSEYRVKIVCKIWNTIRIHVCNMEREEAINNAARFEVEAYTDATSQSEYLQKLSQKILAMEVNSVNSG